MLTPYVAHITLGLYCFFWVLCIKSERQNANRKWRDRPLSAANGLMILRLPRALPLCLSKITSHVFAASFPADDPSALSFCPKNPRGNSHSFSSLHPTRPPLLHLCSEIIPADQFSSLALTFGTLPNINPTFCWFPLISVVLNRRDGLSPLLWILPSFTCFVRAALFSTTLSECVGKCVCPTHHFFSREHKSVFVVCRIMNHKESCPQRSCQLEHDDLTSVDVLNISA